MQALLLTTVGVPLVTFTKGSPLTFGWKVTNDPVMGGLSTATFKVENNSGIFDGVVRIVPSLKAPGFCNAEAVAGLFSKVPDVSAMLQGGIEYKIRNTGTLTSFKASFGTRAEFNFGNYKADFNVMVDRGVSTVFVPFTSFSNKWSAYTGEPTVKCSNDKSVCPTAEALKNIGSVGIWAEGSAGQFRLEIESINAVMNEF